MWGGLGALFVADKALKTACVANGITFPSSLIGMFGVFVLLCLVGDKAATKISSFFNPTLNWIARWLPLWYVASLVTLPLALSTMPGNVLDHSLISQCCTCAGVPAVAHAAAFAHAPWFPKCNGTLVCCTCNAAAGDVQRHSHQDHMVPRWRCCAQCSNKTCSLQCTHATLHTN